MKRSALALLGLLVAVAASPARADDRPPAAGTSLSDIVKQIEARPDFRYVTEVELDDGFYEIEYVTRDGATRNLIIDPATGQERK